MSAPKCECHIPGCLCLVHDVPVTAPGLSPAEAATVARFDAAEAAPESWRGAREWLDDLDAAHSSDERTPGDWVINERSFWHLETTLAKLVPADAALIVAAVNALPELTARLRAVLDLADEMAASAEIRPTYGEFDRGVAAHQRDAADRLRAAVDGAR